MNTTLAERIAVEVRAEMGRQRISQSVLADRTGRTQQTVSRWLRGVGLTVDAVEALCSALEVEPSRLVLQAESAPTPEAIAS